jgi:hypothetical protein
MTDTLTMPLRHPAAERRAHERECARAVSANLRTALHTHHQAFAIPDCALAGTAATAGHDMIDMTAAHILATAVSARMLARGEAAVWQLRAWLRP